MEPGQPRANMPPLVAVLVTHCPAKTLLGYAVRSARYRYLAYAQRTDRGIAPSLLPRPSSMEAAAAAGSELYDLVSDPHERSNLLVRQRRNATVHAAAAAMERALHKLITVRGSDEIHG